MAWATADQVENWTGVADVPTTTIAVASSIIDTVTGADEEMPEDAITTRDRKHLAKAVAWQAVWLGRHPDVIAERESAEQSSSDGQSIKRGDRVDALLAPLARLEVMNLSWVGTRTEYVPPRSAALMRASFLNERSDPSWLGGEGAIP
jgi:hypothetical protein